MKKIFLFLFLFSFFSLNVFRVNNAFADNTYDSNADMLELICGVLGFLTGGVGKALAAFACIGISLAFLGGKVSWTLILTFSLGMACIFGAPSIINAFSGGTDKPCDTVTRAN
jgi:type IV secretory pathway VirB2 component (pilin)